MESIKKIVKGIFYGEVATERMVEYPLAFAYLNYKGAKERGKPKPRA